MTQANMIFQIIRNISIPSAGVILFGIFITYSFQTAVLASTMGTSNLPREDRTIGTFTEGMQIEKDEETGDSILRSAPSPSNNVNNGTDNTTLPPAINIEITPQRKKILPPKK